MLIEKHNPVGDVLPGTLPDNARVVMSRNEISTLCFKAARGAGMSWGLAEEAGFAAGWLYMRGLDGPGELASQLAFATGMSWKDICPEVESGNWRTRAQTPLCPVAFGATLSDHAAMAEAALEDDGLATGPVSYPLLVLPFLASIAASTGRSLSVTCNGKKTCVTADGDVFGDTGTLTDGEPGELNIRFEAHDGEGHAGQAPAPISPDIIRQLNDFALKTTVPASEQSRAGAGSLESDND